MMGIGMRAQFTNTIEVLSNNDDKVITLLNDIGVFAFRDIKAKYPNRVHNLGILEQSTIGIAAGLSISGYIPFFHTIAPFIVERGYEQLKDDFSYQNINGNFISVGASYDYSALGMTHYCPGDIGALMQIPNMQIVIPGTAKEMDSLICSEYDNGSPTYFRLSEVSNKQDNKVEFSKGLVIKKGVQATVIAVGTMLDKVIEAVGDMDVSVLYYTTIKPFDRETLLKNTESKKILLCEPYYFGGLTNEVIQTFEGDAVALDYVGIPHRVLDCYGTIEEMEKDMNMTSSDIRNKLKKLLSK